MFGNLFEEEEEDGFSSTSSRGRAAKGGDEPPPPRGRSNLCGIKNQGGTCYLNSLLQTLLFTPEFRGKARLHFPREVHHCSRFQSADMYLFYLFIHCLVCVFAEELFNLGSEELGCLEDKEKPGAKVSACAEGVTTGVSL